MNRLNDSLFCFNYNLTFPKGAAVASPNEKYVAWTLAQSWDLLLLSYFIARNRTKQLWFSFITSKNFWKWRYQKFKDNWIIRFVDILLPPLSEKICFIIIEWMCLWKVVTSTFAQLIHTVTVWWSRSLNLRSFSLYSRLYSCPSFCAISALFSCIFFRCFHFFAIPFRILSLDIPNNIRLLCV